MSSSILAGERRWVPGPARRGGMTVLGKVVVPKPLNLPSQRLENHGLDPNVEIVPKGSLSWGSRSSSSASNPWGSSALSPNADIASGSPSHLSGRPSSGGSGTRPSTAGSDRTQEPPTSAWGPNSRPSSASGAPTANQTSLTSLRPHSAETRPGSSPLSRFAEPLPENNSGAWGPTGTVDKLVVASSKNDGFSLSSGDFPTLGSEKDNAGKNFESQDHGSRSPPSPSSGRVAHTREKTVTSQADVITGNVNAWKRDGNQHIEDGTQPKAEKWQGDPQQYMNANIPPQQFEAWHGPPMNAPPMNVPPGGVWYRGGPPGGPPYPPVAPGGFPMEPFPYYRPQFPAPPAIMNSQPVPLPGAGPRGHHPPNNVDLYRPHVPDAYIRPGMAPIRPGFYPGPVAYEGYYGPPMGYCNPSDMGMAAAPPVHGRYSAQNTPEAGNNHARAGVRGPTVQVDSCHSEENRGPYKVLMKQHNEWGGKEEEENWERSTPGNNTLSLEKGDQPRRPLQKNEWGADNRRDEDMYSKMSPEGMDKVKGVDDRGGRKSEIAASSPEGPQVRPATPKDPTLIQKIEGLNAKARASDGRHDVSSREEQKNRLQVVNPKANNSTNEERTQITGDIMPSYHKEGVSTGDKIIQSTAIPSRRSYHVAQGRIDDRGKARVNNQDADVWRKKHQVAESFAAVPAANIGHGSRVLAQDHHASVEADAKSEIDLSQKDEEMFDPSDCQEQRAKMRELAKQRAIQLQKEEEERIREQKAKAFAKLEELNRRTQAADCSTQKLGKAPPSIDEQVMIETKDEALSAPLVSQISDNSTSGVGESTLLSRDSHLETPKNAKKEPVVSHGQSLPSKVDVHNSIAVDSTAAPHLNDINVSRQKRVGYKQKQNAQVEKNSTEKLIAVSTVEAPKCNSCVAVNETGSTEVVPGVIGSSCESSLPDSSRVVPESSSHQRRKNNRSSKNKPKLDDTSPPLAIPSPAPREINPVKASSGNGKAKIELDPSPVQSVADLKDPIQPSEQNCSLPTEEAYVRGNNQWKPQQHSRRVQRNPQTNRPADKFHVGDAVIWAPVRPQTKHETTDGGASLKAAPEVANTAPKNDDLGQSNVKSKRAEMERYVPKPVAKELSQQPTPSSVGPTILHETSGRAESGFQGKLGSNVEAKNGDPKQNKPGKSHGAWRQRGSTESRSSLTPNPGKNVPQYMDQHESFKPVEDSLKQEEWNDGWNMPEEPPPAVPVTSAVKDQGAVTGRGKRNLHKGHRNMGNHHDFDQRSTVGGETDKTVIHSAAHEISQTDTVLTTKENRGTGEQKSTQWQAKSQGNYQRGSRSSGGQNVTADKESSAPTQFVSENKYAGKAANVGHQDGRIERRVGSSKGRSHSPNEGFVGGTEEQFSSAAMDARYEQQFSSGFRKNGSQNNRSVRGHESRGDWSSAGQDNRPHNMPPNRERRRQNLHYEYQPVGSYNNSNKSNNFEGPTDGSRTYGSRHRGQAQAQGGRNFNGRRSGTVQVDAGNDWQE